MGRLAKTFWIAALASILWIGSDSGVVDVISISPAYAGVENCPPDCGGSSSSSSSSSQGAQCGDGQCNGSENCSSCPGDCGSCCGDGQCNFGENCSTCSQDCGNCASCGDGSCNGGETCSSCSQDCGACPSCGDGSCNGGENCSSCSQDCGACPFCGDGTCGSGENCGNCSSDCGNCPSCGDGSCNGSETCQTCVNDCGQCGSGCGQPTPNCVQYLGSWYDCSGDAPGDCHPNQNHYYTYYYATCPPTAQGTCYCPSGGYQNTYSGDNTGNQCGPGGTYPNAAPGFQWYTGGTNYNTCEIDRVCIDWEGPDSCPSGYNLVCPGQSGHPGPNGNACYCVDAAAEACSQCEFRRYEQTGTYEWSYTCNPRGGCGCDGNGNVVNVPGSWGPCYKSNKSEYNNVWESGPCHCFFGDQSCTNQDNPDLPDPPLADGSDAPGGDPANDREFYSHDCETTGTYEVTCDCNSRGCATSDEYCSNNPNLPGSGWQADCPSHQLWPSSISRKDRICYCEQDEACPTSNNPNNPNWKRKRVCVPDTNPNPNQALIDNFCSTICDCTCDDGYFEDFQGYCYAVQDNCNPVPAGSTKECLLYAPNTYPENNPSNTTRLRVCECKAGITQCPAGYHQECDSTIDPPVCACVRDQTLDCPPGEYLKCDPNRDPSCQCETGTAGNQCEEDQILQCNGTECICIDNIYDDSANTEQCSTMYTLPDIYEKGVLRDSIADHNGTTFSTQCQHLGNDCVRLTRQGGNFITTNTFGVPINASFLDSADFNKDQCDDLLAAEFGPPDGFGRVRIVRNDTCNYGGAYPEPDWNNPAQFATPRFPESTILQSSSSYEWRGIKAGDFDGDGNQDAVVFQGNTEDFIQEVFLYRNTGNTTTTPFCPTGDCAPGAHPEFETTAYDFMPDQADREKIGRFMWSPQLITVDHNKDGKLDLMIGGAGRKNGSGTFPTQTDEDTWGGAISVLINQCDYADPDGDGTPGPAPGWQPLDGELFPCETGTANFKLRWFNVAPNGYLADGDMLNMPSRRQWFEAQDNGGNYFVDPSLHDDRGQTPIFAYNDFDRDGKKDLIVGAPACCFNPDLRLRLFKGTASLAVDVANFSPLPWLGGATAVLGHDFNLDGKLDVVAASDRFNAQRIDPGCTGWVNGIPNNPECEKPDFNKPFQLGGESMLFRNTCVQDPANPAPCVGNPFDGDQASEITNHGFPTTDFDVAVGFDYDNDPEGTIDLAIGDGNGVNTAFYIFANRVAGQYQTCGTAISNSLSVPVIDADNDQIITDAAVIAKAGADYFLEGGTMQVWFSNQPPDPTGQHDWVPGVACPPTSTGDICAHFPTPGRFLYYKVTMCSGGDNTISPELHKLTFLVNHKEIAELFQAGTVISDGVAYLGSHTEYGDAGHFYAVNAGLDTCYFDVAEKLNFQTDRSIYTTNVDGTGRIEVPQNGTPSQTLHDVFRTTSDQELTETLFWMRSPKFPGKEGYQVHGAVENSTPAVIPPPGLPLWYVLGTDQDRAQVDQFMADYATRDTFVMYGSKGGTIHAIENNVITGDYGLGTTTPKTGLADQCQPNADGSYQDCCADPSITGRNGTEMWAFIPPSVAARMAGDYHNSTILGARVSAYPDGAVSVVDTRNANGELRTIVSLGMGNGGRSVFTMDVTDPDDPQGLWSKYAGGDPNAGKAKNKPVAARIKVNDQERSIMITSSGNDAQDNESGLRVSAIDTFTGETLWKFNALCSVTTDVVAYETDDLLDEIYARQNNLPEPAIDGFMDMVFFCDSCGVCYKLPLSVDLAGGWNKSIPGDKNPQSPTTNNYTPQFNRLLGGKGVVFSTGALPSSLETVAECNPGGQTCAEDYNGITDDQGNKLDPGDNVELETYQRENYTLDTLCSKDPNLQVPTQVVQSTVCTPVQKTKTQCAWWGCFQITYWENNCTTENKPGEFRDLKDRPVHIGSKQVTWKELCMCDYCSNDPNHTFCTGEVCSANQDAPFCGGAPPTDPSCPQLPDFDRTPVTPIAGTTALRADTSGRMVAFFGTGGLEHYSSANQNAFYAVYIDNGQIRGALQAECDNGVCPKFYGGTLVTQVNILTTVTWDPVPGGCDLGKSELWAFNLDSCDTGGTVAGCDIDACQGNFRFEACPVPLSAASISNLYGDAGSVYIATSDGTITRIGEPRARNAGDDTQNQTFQPFSVNLEDGFTLMGWSTL